MLLYSEPHANNLSIRIRYRRVDEVVWVKTNQVKSFLRLLCLEALKHHLAAAHYTCRKDWSLAKV